MEPVLVHGPWSPRYDFGPGHPLTPRRFGPGIELIEAVHGAVGGGPIRRLAPEPASDDVLAWIHTRAYLEAVRRAGEDPSGGTIAGIGPGDTPAFPGMHAAAAAVAGGSLAAMAAILDGRSLHAFHPGGGLHHAMPDRASGFCVYDDPALAIALARRAGLRVLYVDLDVHHGDGVQAIHAADPGVMTVSIHQSGRTLFPGSGFIAELGEGAAAGTVVNLPMDPGTGEDGWIAALRIVLPELAAAFGPDVVVSQHGADAHAWDPLANLRVTTTAMHAADRLVDAAAHRWAGGRWLSTGGGGYDAYRVVPRAWALVWLTALHADGLPPIPTTWRDRWLAEAGRHGPLPLPSTLEDDPNAGSPRDEAQALADRRAVETATTVRMLAVPALVRAARDRGWWPPDGEPVDRAGAAGTSLAGRPTILDRVDSSTWAGLRLEPRVVAPADPATGHALLGAALAGRDHAWLTAAVVGDHVVGLAASARAGDRRQLLALGVAPEHRRAGLGRALLARHLALGDGRPDGEEGPAGGGAALGWDGVVTVAERDVVEPLPSDERSAIARRLLAGAGFEISRAAGRVGAADPRAVAARLG